MFRPLTATVLYVVVRWLETTDLAGSAAFIGVADRQFRISEVVSRQRMDIRTPEAADSRLMHESGKKDATHLTTYL